MNCEDFASLLMDCIEDGLAPEATADARAHLESCEACRRDAAELPVLWERLPLADPGHSAGETPSTRMTERFEESLGALLEAHKLPGRIGVPSGGGGRLLEGPWNHTLITALAATLAIGIGMGVFFGGRFSTSAEVRELRAEMRSVNDVVAVALMKHDAASERLRGVALSSDNLSDGGSDARVIEALFDRVRNDPNDNVRVAAVEALGAAVNRVEVRDGLSASIDLQESPEVQAVVLETLAQSDRGTLDKALASEQLDDDVRQWFLAVAPGFVG